jgi:hypothetical protein
MIKNLCFIRDVSLLFLAVTIIFYSGCNKGKEKYGMRAKDVVTVRDTAKPAMPPLKIVFSTEHIKSVHILSELKDKFGDTGMREILALNRRDTRDIVIGDSICVPDTLPGNFLFFSPFPKRLGVLDSVPKILIFSYPVQAFAAYGNGTLLRWGPTSMGKRTTPTPVGLYSTNWKAKETVSTINEEWILPWAFNIDNFNGISIHEFELPGYPASHSCARLLKSDAEWIYYWADQWILTKDGDSIKAYGTPVIVYGKYDYHSPPPWKLLSENPDADKINEAELVTVIKKYLPTIIRRKNQRDSLLASLRTDTLALSGNHNLN